VTSHGENFLRSLNKWKDRHRSVIIMDSKFKDWTAYDIVGPLNKREVRAAVLDFEIKKGCFRTWDTIERMLGKCSDEVKTVIYESAMSKKAVEESHRIDVLKRRREAVTFERNVRRRIGMV
jgi:hypothetical protein